MERKLAARKVERILICCYLALASGLLTACSTINPPATHIIMGNKEGHLLDPTKGIILKQRIFDKERHAYIKAVLDGIDDHKVVKGKKKILIFVHGGLNSRRTSLRRAEQLTKEMGKDEVGKEYYPVFINWISGPIATYSEHLFFVRQGRVHRVVGPLTSPFYLLADIGRGIVRAPIVIGEQLTSDAKSLTRDYKGRQEPHVLDKLFCELTERYYYAQHGAGEAIKISQGEDARSGLNMTGRAVLYVVTFLPKLLSSALIIDPAGTSSWKNMQRRTKALFQRADADKSTLVKDRLDDPRPGAVALFMDELAKHLDRQPCRDGKQGGCEYEITLIGHSIGTIVLDELIRIHGCRQEDKGTGDKCLEFANIVYLAAATSIRSFKEKVIPYLQANPDAQFYNLMLHELADVRELYGKFLDLPPRGSLLVWIDNFLSSPETPLDRTLGRWENVLQATHVIPEEVRSQITLKAFGVGKAKALSLDFPEGNPQRHSDFTKKGTTFWRPRFWYAHAPDKLSDECP